jgi:hypothetical protein
MLRKITEAERIAIYAVAERLPNELRHQLLDDLVSAEVETVSENGGRITFSLRGYDRPKYRGQHSYGVSGQLFDTDGTQLSFDLYADEAGRLYEMELVRWAEGGKVKPNWESLSLTD